MGAFSANTSPYTFFFGVIDDAPHQEKAYPVAFEPRADQDREFRGPFVELVLQAHEPEHLARVFIERDESHFVAVVEMAELIHLLCAELANVRKKPKSEILGADAG
jgi:hypothetical protein